jgi:small multidrug resistance pump
MWKIPRLNGSYAFRRGKHPNVTFDGQFFKRVPSVVLAGFYLGSFYLLSFAVQMLPLSVVYSAWSGISVLLVAVMSYAIYGDVLRWPAMMGLFFIIFGVVLVNMYTVSQNQ